MHVLHAALIPYRFITIRFSIRLARLTKFKAMLRVRLCSMRRSHSVHRNLDANWNTPFNLIFRVDVVELVGNQEGLDITSRLSCVW